MPARRFLLFVFGCVLLSSCSIISNTFDYRNTSKEFIESLIDEKYDKCVSLFALERPEAKGLNPDTLKKGMATFRGSIVNELGPDIDITFLSAVKQYSTSKESLPDVTEVTIELAGSTNYKIVVFTFNDISKKILNLRPTILNKPVPSM